ncbi:NADPH-dependent 2,4-dienoyl-CoA reductase/sulfur reductase-like enzyme [Nocardioides sp. BE266]|uniref:FAD-dependent oxidoreductase n=1 Tax=Nocardioides sp. BE266 TaxID=2817725 RepID=UPI0028621AEA|nr:FAD-dependent oxidoreductase [Nocardioides sp. BE266]MDR7253248.1 NADPH-dependent 2,4-dienoyl-CoA reductase/sulfur reductase-like enzyme [Nocardioides sp. BE266]
MTSPAATLTSFPLVVIGAGPVGLAAAAHAAERGMDFVVLEAGPDAGAAVGEWSHVRLFSSWSELVDPAARRLLEAAGTWTAPDDSAYPTGGEWRTAYLQPLAEVLDGVAGSAVRFGTRVVGVGRAGRDLMVDSGRESDPFAVHVEGPGGRERLLAGAVVDASGTWTSPNPLGADGYPALGETENAARITYGIPDFRDPDVAARYVGRHVAVAGKGASAQGVLVGLGRLARTDETTRVSWLLRRPSVGDAFGGGDNDQLEQRGKLGQDAKAAAASGFVTTVAQFRTGSVTAQADGRLTISSVDGQQVTDVDEVIVVTGFRPDHSFLSEVRLDLDPALGSARVLADQIHPDHHSCGDVAPHGHRELTQPEAGLFLVGMKSYGRAPSFLAMTGFEQVRSVVAALDGDLEAADRVDLVLPETGVCNGAGAFDDPDAVALSGAGGGCCGPAPAAAAPRLEPQLVTIGAPSGSTLPLAQEESSSGCCG